MADLKRILRETKTIAVMWANPRTSAPAYYVPAYMAAQGYRVYPIHTARIHQGRMLWGQPITDRVDQLPEPIDMVNIFRRTERIIDFVPQILAMDPLPKVVWLQQGLRHAEAARQWREAGIEVIEDRCLMVDHRMARI